MNKKDRNIYIENMNVDEAKKLYLEKLQIRNLYEEINILESLGRITYEAVFAKNSSPHYNAAAMDGIAVNSENTIGATEVSPKILIENSDFKYINTGNPIEAPFDSVIMIEDVIELEKGKIQILSSAYPWQHVRPIGEDIVATEMIIPSKHKIRPIDLGALIAGGMKSVKVYKKPKVGILPTGSEIVDEIGIEEVGRIPDSNSKVFEGLVNEYGGTSNRYLPVDDTYEELKQAILKGIDENDILLINAGSSAGSKDYTVSLIRELGEVFVHGVALKPGKPTILGAINNKPVIGIPGYPVSSFFVFETFVKPIIYSYVGLNEEKDEIVEATISRRVVSSLKSRELLRVNLGLVKDKLIATPLSGGAGVTMSLVKADGIVEIPQNVEGVEAGEKVQVKLLKSVNNIKDTLVSIGSHDLVMDIMSDMMHLSSGHVGSMGGLLSIKREECHIAPIHLLDMETGEYNISYVKKYFPGKKMALIKGLQRLQGFIVEKGNPKSIIDFKDLLRNDIIFINRQRGAGTRILLDYNLKKLGINLQDIKGYNREMTTHMAVAMGVKTGSATTGLGIYSAAKALDLDFIEVGYEDYDFLIHYENFHSEKVQEFISILTSDEFKRRVESLGGYKFLNTGSVRIID
ncbi:molybdenum cofactor biosynthesis protein MoeA [Gottschalkia acidurici 9a]|uniref:Molybdopterin molybdenumtransferase n=1 Tax=Gottschalkia acidurici (strain ATCC 7906 / DSM 604 / BCRC 14475 / CIP 104303 / KCTC 5404 / NCIMB 10678 / 9a) TaxID=1128398 RepID=K0B1P8_GOTA9|nr:molybdopterin biosynthesis protein [Gottschalkia acidurici]AFS79893.1 molybdenum cofactor biosynthesis protein MoeA [Gottschalkia acidurici 9a]